MRDLLIILVAFMGGWMSRAYIERSSVISWIFVFLCGLLLALISGWGL